MATCWAWLTVLYVACNNDHRQGSKPPATAGKRLDTLSENSIVEQFLPKVTGTHAGAHPPISRASSVTAGGGHWAADTDKYPKALQTTAPTPPTPQEPTMTTATPTMDTIPPNLTGHPDGDDIRQWAIYDEHHGMIAAWAHGKKTRSVFLPHIEALDLMVPNYNPDSDEPSNIGLGRTILAYRLAVYDLLPTKPQWAQRMRDNLVRLI